MINNTYTLALDKIHAPELSVERAIKGARQRAASRASAQVKTRRAMTAATVVLALSAGTAYFWLNGSAKPPVSPAPVISPTEAKEETSAAVTEEMPTQRQTDAEEPTQAATERLAQPPETQSVGVLAVPEPVVEDHHETEAPAPSAVPTSEPVTEPVTLPTESTASGEITVEIDISELCDDGKLFGMLAETGLSEISDPDAFTDDKIIYIETKWGVITFRPLTLNPMADLYDNPVSLNESTSFYLYNSAGQILWSKKYN